MSSQLLSNKSEVLLIPCDILISNQGSTLIYSDIIASEKGRHGYGKKRGSKPQLLTGARRS